MTLESGLHPCHGDFLQWLTEGDREYRCFDRIASILQQHISKNILTSIASANHVASAIPSVLSNCDGIEFDKEGEAEAYSILHFLDRYHRFQLVYRTIMQAGYWPRLDRDCVCLDIGTGPAPGLFALCDLYRQISDFREERGFGSIPETAIKCDYVEKSKGMRNWLHHFTEFANVQAAGVKWGVPYHTGSFRDFAAIEFNEPRFVVTSSGLVKRSWRDKKHRFNLVITSNFFTSSQMVTQFADSIQKSALFSKNRGLLIFVGAVSGTAKYREVYKNIGELVLGQDYCGGKYIGSCTEIPLDSAVQSFRWADRFGARLKTVLSEALEILKSYGTLGSIPKETLDTLNKSVLPGYNHETRWELHAYLRKSRLKQHRKR